MTRCKYRSFFVDLGDNGFIDENIVGDVFARMHGWIFIFCLNLCSMRGYVVDCTWPRSGLMHMG